VVIIVQNDVGYICDCAGIVCSAINIVDRDHIGEGACGDVIELHPLDVNEAASGAAVNEGLCSLLDRSIHRLDLYIHCEGHRSRTCCYNVFDGEPTLPGWKATASVWNGGMGGGLHDFSTFCDACMRFYEGIYL
jgi:hypothetical protein